MSYRTQIDTVALQVNCYTPGEQAEIVDSLLKYIASINKDIYIRREVKPLYGLPDVLLVEHTLYFRNTVIATIKTGSSYYVYYIKLIFAGLKRYDIAIDERSYETLMMTCAFLNHNKIMFKISELDICIDVECQFGQILVICTKKTPNTKYFGLTEPQKYSDELCKTTYVEKIPKERLGSATLRAYNYDKSCKHCLSFPLSRFEVKFQSRFFNKHQFSIEAIASTLDRYTIMYFEDINKKNAMIWAYERSKSKYKAEKLDFERYRLYHNMNYIEAFIIGLQYVGIYANSYSDIYNLTPGL